MWCKCVNEQVTPGMGATGPSKELGGTHLRVISVMGRSLLIPGPWVSVVLGAEPSPKQKASEKAASGLHHSGWWADTHWV